MKDFAKRKFLLLYYSGHSRGGADHFAGKNPQLGTGVTNLCAETIIPKWSLDKWKIALPMPSEQIFRWCLVAGGIAVAAVKAAAGCGADQNCCPKK